MAELFYLLFSRITLVWLGIALLFMMVSTHVIWWFERRHPQSIIPKERYVPGIFHAVHWAGTTLVTQSEQTRRHPL